MEKDFPWDTAWEQIECTIYPYVGWERGIERAAEAKFHQAGCKYCTKERFLSDI